MGTGGFLTGVQAFALFALAMGLLVFLIALLGSVVGPALAAPLRVWGRRIQVVAALLILLVGGALVYNALVPGAFMRLVLPT